ncbi:hypothetical protein BR93DRAFT_935858 [Coniochaeta sp. PMI_546]|nr:hypothetical protein BR93DRAFT_935858 [Coniochaeta sp. PMI_546]
MIQHHILDAATLPPLLRSIRGALFPNNAPGTSSLKPPSSDVELHALRRRCASALWALVPKSLGNIYFGRTTAWPWVSQYQRSVAGDRDPGLGVGQGRGARTQLVPGPSGPLASSLPRSGPTDSDIATDTSSVDRSSLAQSSPGGAVVSVGQTAAAQQQQTANTLNGEDAAARAPVGRGGGTDHDGDERILSEIETGVLDVFSDAYCNKHLVYGIVELVLVRLMPELAERGVIELLEERLN